MFFSLVWKIRKEPWEPLHDSILEPLAGVRDFQDANPNPWSPDSISTALYCYVELWPETQVRLNTGPFRISQG